MAHAVALATAAGAGVTRERWLLYADCGMCGALAGEPCKDQRWWWKFHGNYRWTNLPHRGRKRK